MPSMIQDNVDIIDIIALVMIIFNIFVFCPILIYYLILYRQYETRSSNNKPPTNHNINKTETNVIQQRNSFLIYTINILTIFTNCTERVYMVSSEIWGIIHVPFWSVSLFLAITWWAIMDLFAIKVYHLYYRQQLKQAIADRSWKKHINPHSDDWYILNRYTYGNPFYLIKLMFIPYVISVLIDVGLFAFFFVGILLDLSHLTLATIPITIAMWVFWKSRKLNDIYRIRNEIFYQFVILLSTLSIYMIIFMLCEWIIPGGHQSADHGRHHNMVHRFEWMTYIFITDAVTFSLALFSTLYPIYLTKKKRHMLGSHLLKKHGSQCSSSGSRSHSANGVQGINSVMRNYDSFTVFMEYLVSEFCPENLLYLVELIQIKHSYQVRNNNLVRIPKESAVPSEYISIDRDKRKNTAEGLELEIMSSSMKKKSNTVFQVIDFNIQCNNTDNDNCISSYLFNDDGSIMTQVMVTSQIPSSIILSVAPNNLYLQMKMLHEKYVIVDSEYELNIPYFMRDSLTQYFESICEKDVEDREYNLFNIMDTCCIEIVQLLCNSFNRFSGTDQYKLVIADIDTFENVDDVALKRKLNSELPVLRNATSYSKMKRQYEP